MAGKRAVDEETMRKIFREEMCAALKSLGIDYNDALENQKDFAWLRTWRLAITLGGGRGLLAAGTVIVVGTLGAILTAFGVPERILRLVGFG